MPDDAALPWSGEFSQLDADDRRAVAELVKAGGAIIGTVAEIAFRLDRTRRIALLRRPATGRIIGAAALKTPRGGYRADKFEKAGVAITGFEHAIELGYVVIAEDMQGRRLSGGLVEAIAADLSQPTFATTDSNTMKHNLARSGFTQSGGAWQGQKGMLSLWTFASR
jgi:hypothetical protein